MADKFHGHIRISESETDAIRRFPLEALACSGPIAAPSWFHRPSVPSYQRDEGFPGVPLVTGFIAAFNDCTYQHKPKAKRFYSRFWVSSRRDW